MQNSGCGDNYISYTIARGQTLYQIARQFNTTVEDILAANPALDVQLYFAGDVICIPRAGTSCVGGTAYTIRRGDSFFLIAQRFNVTLANLLAANPGVDPARLQVGQVICVPAVPTPTPTCPAGYTLHTVIRGQTFVDILVLYNISFFALRQANPGVDLEQLTPGMELCVAPAGSRGSCATGKGPYVIETGDTLSTIATKFRTTVGSIMVANPTLTPTDFGAGRIICLPENATVVS